jgi:hypothetical protein
VIAKQAEEVAQTPGLLHQEHALLCYREIVIETILPVVVVLIKVVVVVLIKVVVMVVIVVVIKTR